MSPRGWRGSGTRRGILINESVHILPKTLEGYARRAGESSLYSFDRYESPLSQGDQFPYGHTITRDDEGFALVQGPHDSPAFVAKLPLGDAPLHCDSL